MKMNGLYTKPGNDFSVALDNDSYDDDDDSDAKQLFELPKRKIIRPPSISLKRKIGKASCWLSIFKCCKVCVTTVLPVVLSVFIISMVLCLSYLLVGISGIKNEIQLLKIRLNHVQDSEETSLLRHEQIRKGFQDKLETIKKHHTVLDNLEERIEGFSTRLDKLNQTLFILQKHPSFHLSAKLNDMVRDIDTLKTGMADTGAEISELKGNDKKTLKEVIALKKDMKSTRDTLFNTTVLISKLEHKPPPSLTTTPKTLVVTMMPDEDIPVKRKELKKKLKEFEKKQQKLCENENLIVIKELNTFKNQTDVANEAQQGEISKLKKLLISVLQTKLQIKPDNISTTRTTVMTPILKPTVVPTEIIKNMINNTNENDENSISNVTGGESTIILPTQKKVDIKITNSSSSYVTDPSHDFINSTQKTVHHNKDGDSLNVSSNSSAQYVPPHDFLNPTQKTVHHNEERKSSNVSTENQEIDDKNISEKRSSGDELGEMNSKVDIPLDNLDNSEMYNERRSTESVPLFHKPNNPLPRKHQSFEMANEDEYPSFDDESGTTSPPFNGDNEQGNFLLDMDTKQRTKYLKSLSREELRELVSDMKPNAQDEKKLSSYDKHQENHLYDIINRYRGVDDGDDDDD